MEILRNTLIPTIICENLQEIFNDKVKGRNFIVEANYQKAKAVKDVQEIYYSVDEEVYVVVFNADLKSVLEKKINEINQKKSANR